MGAVAWPTGAEFYSEPRLFPGAVVEDAALRINGFTHDDINSVTRQPMAEVLAEFLTWAKANADDLILAAWNANFDVSFLKNEFKRCNLDWPFLYRSVDLHSVGFFLLQSLDKFTPKHDGVSTVGLNYIMKWADLPPEPEPHNALTGAQCNLAVWKHCVAIMENGKVDMPDVPQCPKCGAPMSLKKPKPEQHWDEFYGCTRYPDCKGTISV